MSFFKKFWSEGVADKVVLTQADVLETQNQADEIFNRISSQAQVEVIRRRQELERRRANAPTSQFLELDRKSDQLLRQLQREEEIKIFNKKKKQEAAATNRAIYEAVYGVQNTMISDMKKSLEGLKESPEERIAAQMAALGFHNAEGIREVTNKKKVREELQANLELIEGYQMRYPLNRFITMKKMKEIGAKYGLLIASAEKYKADIPEKNREEIVNFRVNKTDIDISEIAEIFYGRISRRFLHDHGFHLDPRGRTRLQRINDMEEVSAKIDVPEHAQNWLMLTVEEARVKAGSDSMPGCLLVIMAPADKLDTSNMINVNGIMVQPDDPIVLQPVKGGFLIVTSWGLEAQDPDILNPIVN